MFIIVMLYSLCTKNLHKVVIMFDRLEDTGSSEEINALGGDATLRQVM